MTDPSSIIRQPWARLARRSSANRSPGPRVSCRAGRGKTQTRSDRRSRRTACGRTPLSRRWRELHQHRLHGRVVGRADGAARVLPPVLLRVAAREHDEPRIAKQPTRHRSRRPAAPWSATCTYWCRSGSRRRATPCTVRSGGVASISPAPSTCFDSSDGKPGTSCSHVTVIVLEEDESVQSTWWRSCWSA